MKKQILIITAIILLIGVVSAAQSCQLYDDFSSGTLDTEKWEVRQDVEGQPFIEEYGVIEENGSFVFHTQQNTIADQRVYLVPKYQFKAGDKISYDTNLISKEGHYMQMALLTGDQYIRIGIFGYISGIQGYDELGTSHIEIIFGENTLILNRESPSGQTFHDVLSLNNPDGVYELYIGSVSGHNGRVHVDFDNFEICTGEKMISNMEGVYIDDFIAGDTTTANFSFDYLSSIGGNTPDSPLVIKVNISSLDEEYPVLKGDFELSGSIKRYWIFPWIERAEIPLVCSEESPLTINHPHGPTTLDVPDGIFYCYNIYYNLDLDEHDKVTLNIKSHPALYPGEYNILVELFSVLDLENPVVEILNKDFFADNTLTISSYFEANALVSDNVEILSCKGIIKNNGNNITIIGNYDGEKCDFIIHNLPTTINEGICLFEARAYDTSGNIGSDFMNIIIDNSPPSINLKKPKEGEVYGEIIPIELNIIDEYSEIADESVQYKIKDLGCPDTGIGFGNATCFNSGWINADFDSPGHYVDDFNATEQGLLDSGTYWFEARACDVLYDDTLFTNTSIDPRHCIEL